MEVWRAHSLGRCALIWHSRRGNACCAGAVLLESKVIHLQQTLNSVSAVCTAQPMITMPALAISFVNSESRAAKDKTLLVDSHDVYLADTHIPHEEVCTRGLCAIRWGTP